MVQRQTETPMRLLPPFIGLMMLGGASGSSAPTIVADTSLSVLARGRVFDGVGALSGGGATSVLLPT